MVLISKMLNIQDLRNNLAKYGQEHLLQFWDSLTNSEKEELIRDIDEMNLEAVVHDFQKATSISKTEEKFDNNMKPVPKSLFGNVNTTSINTLKSYEEEGLRLISENKIAALVLAGGQGTRLGVSYPKGMFDVGLPSHKSLFQLQAERILKLQELACKNNSKQGAITWFIMVGESTMQPTIDFLKKKQYFGLEEKNVVIFKQFMLPAFTFDGQIFLEKKHKIAMSPDGNGGIYRALKDNKILDMMEMRGIEYVHIFSIDNILLKVGDPIFIGYCIKQKADCAVKVIEKVIPDEPIGIVCMVNEKWQVIEYSEISQKTTEKRADDGSLLFKAGNICNHIFKSSFLRKIAENYIPEIKLHIAKKKIKFVDKDGTQVSPKVPNGIKMEKFIFDVFPFAEKLVVWDVNRDEEFSALKNSDEVGKDCPSSARKDIYRLHKKWIEKAGGKFDEEDVVCEISPLLSYSGEGLEKIVEGQIFSSPLYLKSPCD